MATPLPKVIRVQTLRDDVTYHLPLRPLGKLRWAGIFLVGFAALFLSVPGTMFLQLLKKGVQGVEWVFVVFMLPFFAAGCVPLTIGIFILIGHTRVEWRQKRLSAVECAGPLRWRRRMPAEKPLKLTVQTSDAKVNGRRVTSGPLANLGALSAEFSTGKPRLVAIAYPHEWLQALGEHLSARLGRVPGGTEALPVEVQEMKDDEVASLHEDIPEQPAGSRVKVERHRDGITMTVPPAGIWKGSKGLFLFGLFWCAFMVVFSSIWIFAAKPGSKSFPWFVWLFIAAFWAIGLGMLSGAVNMGRRRATLRLDAHRLVIDQQGPFGAKHWEWPRADVADVRADASGMAVNNVPVIELQVHSKSGKKTGLLAGRDADELRWLATELRRALNGKPEDETTAETPTAKP